MGDGLGQGSSQFNQWVMALNADMEAQGRNVWLIVQVRYIPSLVQIIIRFWRGSCFFLWYELSSIFGVDHHRCACISHDSIRFQRIPLYFELFDFIA
jgi:hypothetical protein